MQSPGAEKKLSSYRPALQVALFFFIISFLWIALSDKLLAYLFSDASAINRLQTFKGWFYITCVSILIFFIVYREIKKRDNLIALLNEEGEWYQHLLNHIPGVDLFLIDARGELIVSYYPNLKQKGFRQGDNNSINEFFRDHEKLNSLLSEARHSILIGAKLDRDLNMEENIFKIVGIPINSHALSLIGGLIVVIDTTEQHNNLVALKDKISQYESLYEEYLSQSNELRLVNNKLKTTNSNLELSEKKYRLFFENINDAAFIYEFTDDIRKGKFLEVNQNLANQLGVEKEELLTKKLDSIFVDMSELLQAVDNSKETATSQIVETLLHTEYEKAIPFAISLYVTSFSDKKVLLSIARNIEERTKIIEELTIAKKRAEGANQLKEAFLANMSHEVRTPLNGILGFTRIMASSDLSRDKVAKYINIIKDSSNQLLTIINDILDLSKIETGQLTLFYENFSLKEFIENLRTYADEIIEDKKSPLVLLFENKYPEGEIIKSDKSKLERISKILIDNAVKFTEKGSVQFTCADSKGGWLHFTVADTGIGIPEEKLDTIFENFIQADGASNRDFGGNGVGLAIVRGLIDFMGGRIEVSSVYGKGTQFDFYIPIQA